MAVAQETKINLKFSLVQRQILICKKPSSNFMEYQAFCKHFASCLHVLSGSPFQRSYQEYCRQIVHTVEVFRSPFDIPSSQILRSFAETLNKSQTFLLLSCPWHKASWFFKDKEQLQQCADLSRIRINYFFVNFTLQAQMSEYPCLSHLSWPACNCTHMPLVLMFTRALEK